MLPSRSLCLILLALSPNALAEPADASGLTFNLERDDGDSRKEIEQADSAAAPERAFSYVEDPSLPKPMQLLASYSAGYASTGATRPLAATKRRGGLVNELHLEASPHERISGFVGGQIAPPLEGERNAQSAFDAGVRVRVTAPDAKDFRLTLGGMFVRDFTEVNAAALRIDASYDMGRVRLATMLHSEKAFDESRDEVDFYAATGVSVRMIDTLRGGLEYVAQDLEAAWEPEEAEGGLRHFAGATLAWAYEDRILITAGPAIGLSQAAPNFLGRASLTYAF
ncbi:MAG: hypothetical protein AB7K71_04465 [Polyangiaceae bacterium]